jgi:hypothetical protein
MPKLQEKPSTLKREYPALQNMKISTFFYIFLGIFGLLDPVRILNADPDPDPATQIIADRDPDADPDPQP